MGALIISDPNPSDFQVVVLVVAFCFSSGDTFKRSSSKLVIFASAEGGKRGGGGGRQTPKQAATTAKAACEEKREGGSLTYLSCLCPPFPPPPFKEDEGERRRFLFPSSKRVLWAREKAVAVVGGDRGFFIRADAKGGVGGAA